MLCTLWDPIVFTFMDKFKSFASKGVTCKSVRAQRFSLTAPDKPRSPRGSSRGLWAVYVPPLYIYIYIYIYIYSASYGLISISEAQL